MPLNFPRRYSGNWEEPDAGGMSQAGAGGMAQASDSQRLAYSQQGAGQSVAQNQISYYINPYNGERVGFPAPPVDHTRAPRRESVGPNVYHVLEEFNTAFLGGIREVVVARGVYADLINYFNTRYYIAPEERGPAQNFLTINTRDGSMIVRPEGSSNFATDEQFEKYMEYVDDKDKRLP